MKLLGVLSVLSAVAFAYKQTSIYIDSNLTNGNVNQHFQKLLDAGYDTFYMGFYFSLYGCQGACLDWTFTLTADQRNDIKSMLASYNARLFLVLGGPGEFWEDCIDNNYITDCATTTASQVAKFAKDNQFDGIELSVGLAGEGTTNSEYANDGSFRNMTQTLVSTIKSNGWTTNDIHLSAAAPYFSRYSNLQLNLDYSMSYFCLANMGSDNPNSDYAVSKCIMKMYNEANNYMTYQDMFIKNNYNDPSFGIFGQESSVEEVSNYGISPSMLMVMKPVAQNEESVRSGYVNSQTLGSWGCQAFNDFGWNGGFAIWAWDEYTIYNFDVLVDFQTTIAGLDCSNVVDTTTSAPETVTTLAPTTTTTMGWTTA